MRIGKKLYGSPPIKLVTLGAVIALLGLTQSTAAGGDNEADRRFAVAWTALGHGETASAAASLRLIGHDYPHHTSTARLVAALNRLDLPVPDADVSATQAELPGVWQIERGPHVSLIHRAPPGVSTARVELLEKVTTSYYLLMASLGFDLPAPRRRLVSIACDDREVFRASLKRWGASAFEEDWGCYLPARHLVLTRTSYGESPTVEALGISAAAHEMVHQLVAESGLEPRPGAFPTWLAEGLAAQFEPTAGTRWAGFMPPNQIRLAECRRSQPPGSLHPLLLDLDHARPAYGPAWALVHLLLAEEPAAMTSLIDQLRAPDDLTPGRPMAAARRAFGEDLGPLEARWRARIRSQSGGSTASR